MLLNYKPPVNACHADNKPRVDTTPPATTPPTPANPNATPDASAMTLTQVAFPVSMGRYTRLPLATNARRPATTPPVVPLLAILPPSLVQPSSNTAIL